MLDFSPLFQADTTTLAIAVVGVIVLGGLIWYAYRRFFSSQQQAYAKQEELSAVSTDHSQAPPEEDQPRETFPDEQASEHLAPSQDIPE
jgi:hypothetical protein